MNALALVSVVAGALIIAVRGPFVLAPAGAAARGRAFIASSTRLRAAGLLFGGLGLAMILSAQGSAQGVAWVISVIGWLWMLSSVFLLLIFTAFYQRIAVRIMDALDEGVLMRASGVIGTLLGAFLVYLGIGVF